MVDAPVTIDDRPSTSALDQRLRHVVGRGVAIGGRLGEGPHHRRIHCWRDGAARAGERPRVLGDAPGDDRLGRGPGEWRFAGHHLVEHAAERVDVGAAVEVGLAAGLLGTHVGRGADGEPGLGERAGILGGPGDAEVGHQRVPLVDQDVGRLDVAVDDPPLVGIGQRLGHLAGEADRLVDRQLPLALEAGRERLALDHRHHVVEDAALGARIVHRQDVGVAEPRRDLDLAQEPLGAEGLGQLGAHHLDRHLAVVLEVLGQVHRGHAALAQHPLDPVALGQRPADPVDLDRPGGHGALGHPRLGGRGRAALEAEEGLVGERSLAVGAGAWHGGHGTPKLWRGPLKKRRDGEGRKQVIPSGAP